ncbi:MAG: LCP family protein [Candidatus Nanopelagicales bacterium]
MSRIARTVVAVASALVLMVSVTGWAASTRYLSGLSQVNVFNGLGGSSIADGGPTNILVVGSDDRSGLSTRQRNRLHAGPDDYGRHTDTMMLVHIGGDLGTISVVSIPRDSLVTIPAHTSTDGTAVPEHQGKINSAFSTGGPAVTVQTVEQATGLTIDHYVEVNFAGFLSMVDAVGGVEVCLQTPLQDQLSGLDLPAGRQTISGPQALAYVRARYIDNDFGRAGRQQKFLSAMAQKVFSAGTLLNPVALNNFVDAAVHSVTTDERLDRDTIAALAGRAADLDLGRVQFTTVPVSDGNHMANGESTVLWDGEAAGALFHALAEDQPLPQPPKATQVEVSPGEISLAVAPAGPQGQHAVSDLQAAGFTVSQVAPPATPPATTVVRFDPAMPKSLATVKAALPGATFQPVPGMGETFSVVIGNDYAGVAPVRAAATTVEQTVRSAKDDICG